MLIYIVVFPRYDIITACDKSSGDYQEQPENVKYLLNSMSPFFSLFNKINHTSYRTISKIMELLLTSVSQKYPCLVFHYEKSL